jgi:hypothetical protein
MVAAYVPREETPMAEIGKILQSPEYWFVAVFSGVVVSVIANAVTKFLPSFFTGRGLKVLLTANAALFGALIASGRAPLTTSTYVDWVAAFGLVAFYTLAAWSPSLKLRAFAFLAPNCTMLVMIALTSRAWDEPNYWASALASYPLAFLLFAVPVMLWTQTWLTRLMEAFGPQHAP